MPRVGSARSTRVPTSTSSRACCLARWPACSASWSSPVQPFRADVAFPAVDEESLRDTLARLPAGVALVTTRDDHGFRGLTVTSFTSVSLVPPLVLVCLDRLATAREALVGHGAFTARLLSRGQQFLADRFSGQAPVADPAWRDVAHRLGENGLPIVDGAVAWIECRVRSF